MSNCLQVYGCLYIAAEVRELLRVFVHTVLFRARRFMPHNVDTAEEHQPARARTH